MIKFCRPDGRSFESTGATQGDIRIARDVTVHDSSTMGCGVMTLEDCAAEWTVLYDEYLYCIDGELTLKTKEGDYILTPGCSIWLPRGTWLIYQAGARATVLFTIYPVNWRDTEPHATKS
jgi:ethanolamine utilization protein EutQ (cupin superfamily)